MPESRRGQTLPRNVRIRSRSVFERIMQARVRVSDHWITAYGGQNSLAITRLGIAAGHRLGNAVRRNRLKRLVREAFRRIRHQLPPGLDLIVLPRPGTAPTVPDLQCSILRLATKLAEKLPLNAGS